MSATATPTVYARRQSAEHSAWLLGHFLITFLATGADTNGRFSLVEVRGRPGGEPPPHLHRNEDEAFYVVEGEVTFFANGQAIAGSAGSWVYIPRGTVHTFAIESPTATVLSLHTPAGFEGFFREMSEPATTLTLPTPAGPPDIPRLIAVASKYGMEIAGR